MLASKLAVPLLLAEESYRLDPNAAVTRGALQASVSSISWLERLLPFGAASRTIVSRDGSLLADATANGAVRLYDLAHDRPPGLLPSAASAGHDPVTSVLLSPDGARGGSVRGEARQLWDVATRRRSVASAPLGTATPSLVDAETLFTADEGGIVSRRDVADPNHPVRSDIAAGPASPAGFPPFMARPSTISICSRSATTTRCCTSIELPDVGPAIRIGGRPRGDRARSVPTGRVRGFGAREHRDLRPDRSIPTARPMQRSRRRPGTRTFPSPHRSGLPTPGGSRSGSFQSVVSVLDADDLTAWRDPLDTHGEYATPLAVLDADAAS